MAVEAARAVVGLVDRRCRSLVVTLWLGSCLQSALRGEGHGARVVVCADQHLLPVAVTIALLLFKSGLLGRPQPLRLGWHMLS